MWYEKLAKSNQLSLETGEYDGLFGNAIFNKEGTRRYFLEKRWAQEGNVLTAVMMNPSNAAHNHSDETVDQLINVAKDQGCHALHVVNVASIIEGTANNLRKAHFAFETINWTFVSAAMKEADVVFLGWGSRAQKEMLEHQQSNSDLVNAFNNVSNKIYCYDVVESEDKRFAENPLYYVPHPRPRSGKDKYRNVPIRLITNREFIQLFIR